MPFSFLNPWLWLGALAVAAPIWLHLRHKKETNIVLFSAVRFLEDEREPRRTPLQVHHWLLLAVRLLALMALVTAFAWPYLPKANLVPIKESRVYILDNTLSHQANDGFTHDRDRIVRDLSEAGPDLQIAVVELAALPRVLVGFADEHQAALDRLKELQPSFQRGSYLAAFRQANALLANSLGETKRIVLCGDNQENQWNENANTPAFLRNVQVDLPKPQPSFLPNLSLSEPRAQRIFLGDKSLVSFTVKLSRVGNAKLATVILRSNGQTIFNRVVELEQQPETILLQAQWEADPASWLRGEATVEGVPDSLAADNRVFFSLPPVQEGKVALLAQSPYLRLALSPDIMRGQWALRVLDPSKLQAELAARQDADVLCLESSYLQSADARKLLWRYLTNGRGALLVVNRLTPAIDGCLRELGFESEGMVQSDTAAEKFQFVFSNHPIFHPFLSTEYGTLMDIKVSQYARLRPTAAMPLIYSESGAGLFFQGTKLPGKLFVTAFGLDREHTSWPIHQTFIPFMDLTLQAARAEDPTPTSFEPGELSLIQLPPSTTAREVVLRQGREEIVRGLVEQGKVQIRMPDKPGLYTLSYDEGDKVEKMFSINPSSKESQLVYTDSPAALRLWALNPTAESAKTPVAAGHKQVRLAGILQQRFWWWMVLGGLVALLIEMTLVASGKESK